MRGAGRWGETLPTINNLWREREIMNTEDLRMNNWIIRTGCDRKRHKQFPL